MLLNTQLGHRRTQVTAERGLCSGEVAVLSAQSLHFLVEVIEPRWTQLLWLHVSQQSRTNAATGLAISAIRLGGVG